jgi:tRNA (guanosine-2'-O-)-methyltransferase
MDVLNQRQTDLTVCMDQVNKPHNISAIIRSCEAVGVHRLHMVLDKAFELRSGTAKGSQHWVELQQSHDIESTLSGMQQQGMQILVTNFSEQAVDFREIDYCKPTAIVVGQEKYGVSSKAVEMADQSIVIPMMGMVQSLNVSVATALVLYEAQRQRQLAGLYERAMLPDDVCQNILFSTGYPDLYQHWKLRDLPMPVINTQGEIIADDDWWEVMRQIC